MKPSEQIKARAMELYKPDYADRRWPEKLNAAKWDALMEYLDCLERPLVDAGVIADSGGREKASAK